MKAYRAKEVTPLLASDAQLMQLWKEAAGEDAIVAFQKNGENWVGVRDAALAAMLEARGLKGEPWNG
ncbi:hypothetical protein [Oceanithermus sp.]|uniref:hypothetical protein n=1 Tax=Oceanithermus sp. TaxID=2268145 RepID=UPI0026013F71|nr:hypothetical protein [Oceanithermus sp.]